MGVPGGLPGDTRKLCVCGRGVIHVFSILTMVMVLRIYTYVKAYIVHFQYVQLLCVTIISQYSCFFKRSRNLSEVLRKNLQRLKNAFSTRIIKASFLTWNQLSADNLKN